MLLPHSCGFMFAVLTAPLRFSETHKLTWLQSCQPWSYRRLVAYSFLGLARGHRVIEETRCQRTQNRLTSGWILSLDPSVSRRTRLATAKDDPQGMERTLCPRRSSCLRFQLFGVEMGSFLPDD
jgi:hypothetical protein